MRHFRLLGEDGAVAVEFALVATIFIMMVLGILELGYMFFVQSVLDEAARDAARLIRTGQVQSSGNASAQLQAFQTRVCNDAAPIISCGNIVFQAQVFPSWSAAQTAVQQPPKRDKYGNLIPVGFTAGGG